jgi:hypothetical protein
MKDNIMLINTSRARLIDNTERMKVQEELIAAHQRREYSEHIWRYYFSDVDADDMLQRLFQRVFLCDMLLTALTNKFEASLQIVVHVV